MRLRLVLSTLSILQVRRLRHKAVIIKNYEKFEILPFLQAYKLASHTLMDASRRQKIPKSETNVLITHGITGGMNFIVLCFLSSLGVI